MVFMEKKTSAWSTDRIMAICAIVTSVLSISICIYQTHLTLKEQKASVWPHLHIAQPAFWGIPGKSKYAFNIVNDGIGPAIIVKCGIYYKGIYYEKGVEKFINTFENSVLKDRPLNFYGNIEQMVVSSGNVIEFLSSSFPEKDAQFLHNFFYNEATIEIIYKSVYDEYWRVTSKLRAEKIDYSEDTP